MKAKPSCGKSGAFDNNAIRKLSIRLDDISQSNNTENSTSIIEETSTHHKSITPTGLNKPIHFNSRNNSNNGGILSARNCYPSSNRNEVDSMMVRNKTTFGHRNNKYNKPETRTTGRTIS